MRRFLTGTWTLLALGVLVTPTLSADDETAVKPLDTTLGQEPPEGAVVLIGGGDELTGWVQRDGSPAEWPFEDGVLTVGQRQGDILTENRFGSFQLHVEFSVPYMPDARGQARGNSGVYLHGQYEVQVLDSYGIEEPQANDCGAIYAQIAPAVNACKPPLQWQTYDITFHAPQTDGDEVVKKARVTVVHNGITTIDDAEIDVTPGGVEVAPGAPGPILLQDHGDAVQYRNIWLKPLD